MLKDEDDPKFTGFSFHAQNDVDFATMPYKWEGHTKDTTTTAPKCVELVRVSRTTLSEIRQSNLRSEAAAEESRGLLASPSQSRSSTSTVVLGSKTPGGEVREALQRSHYRT